MNTLDFKEGQTYICTKSDKQWWTVGKEYPVFLDSDNEPAIRDDDGDDWHPSYLSISNNQFKLKEEQPKVTLDEPKKPVVPKFVAEWIEYAKKKGDSLAISFKPWNLYGVEYSKADRWIEDNQETFARAWIDGYEVEKEPMYRVKLGEGYFVEYQGRGALIIPDDNKEIKIFDSKSDADRTAQTIGGAVEEVAI
ncbi:DUF1642 domain-containing protein [Enterococcus faecium]|uniref:DUF1642 domain-containing protein n=1 Tax=Enterococcus TaxID=1350 RepID=UPI0009F3A392|nr:DUF1642 domain-containing protein [Enterococcus sp. HMSC072F02]MDB7280642.1 DUF1642 domain-containing protein [Enterococcus faecium]MDB7283285.1 DUF1642 domain-containing protein [Enterococcus faecium]MDB7288369.1 DUF1642 domain-containing protein [Enterococcus faecium]MDB7293454.1 DUF1642 domain-containing protein [Enterococcus faecium]MDB7303445.1 DUF1642 domain-containing protein [Enterococcus faecium]